MISSSTLLQRAGMARQAHPSSALDKVIINVALGAGFCFAGADLLVESLSTPGKVYTVDCAGVCDCRATRPCWHVALRRLLEEAPAPAVEAPMLSLSVRLAIARRALQGAL